jgi:hypothetical protein
MRSLATLFIPAALAACTSTRPEPGRIVLSNATGAPDEALYFELRLDGRVVAFLGRVPPQRP